MGRGVWSEHRSQKVTSSLVCPPHHLDILDMVNIVDKLDMVDMVDIVDIAAWQKN